MTTLHFYDDINVKLIELDFDMFEDLVHLYTYLTSHYANLFHEDLVKLIEQEQISCIECKPIRDLFELILTTKHANRFFIGYIDKEMTTIKLP